MERLYIFWRKGRTLCHLGYFWNSASSYLPLGISLIHWRSSKENRICWGPTLEVKEQVNRTGLLDGSHASEAEGAERGLRGKDWEQSSQ